ncbi:MAG TPA: xanthine dehydrogenase family protein molybdopterin-binding subunit, partial [Chloroflexota bacterium]
TGRAEYVADIALPGMAHVAFVRSSVAHGDIRSVDVSAAKAAAGVQAVLTGADIARHARPFVCDSLHPSWQSSAYHQLALDRVRFVGEPVVAVLADDRYLAEDACELVRVDYASRPAITSIAIATAPGAPLIHDSWKDNFYVRREFKKGDVDTAFASAHGVVALDLKTERQAAMPLEGRGCVASYDSRDGVLTAWMSTQTPHLMRTGLADMLGISENRVRVIAPDVGGGFGTKCHLFPEDVVAAVFAIVTGRPVKWIEDRQEHFLGSIHARQHEHHVELAYAEDGTVLALRGSIYVDCGAYSMWPWTSTMDTGMALGILPGPYRIQNYECEAYSVATNKCPHGAYRGVSRPAACFSIERAIDEVGRRLGLGQVEIRRRNLVRPDEFPYISATELTYDSGSFIESLEKVCEIGDYEGMRSTQRQARSEGRLLGIGLACYTEQTAHATQEFRKRYVPVVPGFEAALVRMDPSGTVSVHLSTHSHGQGHETSMAQLVADQLTLPLERVQVHLGQTEATPYGHGTFASRSAVLGGGACVKAAGKVREKLRDFAAHTLEVSGEDLELRDGAFNVRGSAQHRVSITDLARWAYHRPEKLPPDMEPSIEAVAAYDAPPGLGTFANAVQLALIEVDPELGKIDVLRYTVVEDCGRMINPLIVKGQVHGGVAQGIGGALLEELDYDDDGQLRTTTFMDYALPGSTDIPRIDVGHIETPSPFTVEGIKGMGEGGAIAPGPAIAAALEDALAPLAHVPVTSLPLTWDRVRQLVKKAQQAAEG